MQAVINMATEGTKLRPASCSVCTAMLPMGEMPLAGRMIETLKKCRIKNFILIVGYMAGDIEQYFGDGSEWGVSIKYARSEKGDGVLKSLADMLEEEFIYFAKPIYAEADFDDVINFHRDRGSYATIVKSHEGGRHIVATQKGKVTRLEENRLWDSLIGRERSMGVYVLNRDILRFIPDESESDLFMNVFPSVIRSGKNVYVTSCRGVCESITDFASYMRSCFALCDQRQKKYNKGIRTDEGAVVEKGALLEGPCYIGKNAHIHKGAKIGAYTTIGEGCVVHSGASIKRSVIFAGCRIGKNSALRGCILSEGVNIGENVTVFEQAVIGKGTKIGNNALVKSFVKIWPEKSVGENTTVSENIMWGQKKRTNLYNKGVIDGVINADITPRFCAGLGESIGMCFDMGAVGVATDGSPQSAMIRDGIVSGLLGMGCTVKDFGEQPVPITRKGIAFYMLKGGINIITSEKNGEEIAEIIVLQSDGADIDDKTKKRLEDYFERGEFLFPEGKEIKECEYLFEYKIHYLKELVGKTNKKYTKKKILLSCPSVWGRRLLVSAMQDFSASVSMYKPYVTDESGKREFEKAVEAGGFDIGFMLDTKCETLRITLPGKETVEGDVYDALCALIVMKTNKAAKVYVPYDASSAIDILGEKYSASVVRSTNPAREMLNSIQSDEKEISDQYVLKYDAVGAVIKIMDFLQEQSLEKAVEEIPPISVARAVVEMPKEDMEKVMNRIRAIEQNGEDNSGGVKITLDKGWVVVLPDGEREVFQIASEGATMEAAKEICDFCVRTILNVK